MVNFSNKYMPYVFKQKFNVAELAGVVSPSRKVLLVISEDTLRDIYYRLFTQHNFDVSSAAFGDHVAMAGHLGSAGLLVIDFKNPEEDDKLEFLKIISSDFPQVSVITIGHALDE